MSIIATIIFVVFLICFYIEFFKEKNIEKLYSPLLPPFLLTSIVLPFQASTISKNIELSVIACGLILIPFLLSKTRKKISKSPKYTKKYYATITIIIALSTTFYLINLGKLGVTFDEGIGWLAIEMIHQKGIPELPTGIYYNRGLPYYYLNAAITWILGLNEFTIRILSVLSFAGLAAFGTKILHMLKTSKSTVVLFLIFLSSHYWIATMSRWGRMYMFTATLNIIALYFFLTYIKKRTYLHLALFTLIAIAAIGSHNSGFITFAYIPAFILSKYHINIAKHIRSIKKEFALIISFIVLIASRFFWSYLGSLSQLYLSIDEQDSTITKKVVKGFHVNFLPNREILEKIIIEFWYLIPLIAIGAIATIKQHQNAAAKTLYAISSLTLIALPFMSRSLAGGRIVFFAFILCIIPAFASIENFKKKIGMSIAAGLVLIAITTNGFAIPFHNYGSKIQPFYAPSHVVDFYPDNKSPAEIVAKNITSDDILIFFGYPLRSYPYIKNVDVNNIYQIRRERPGTVNLLQNNQLGFNIIYEQTKLDEIIKNTTGDVYIITTFSILSGSESQPSLQHFDSTFFEKIIKENEHNIEVLTTGEDGISKAIKIHRK